MANPITVTMEGTLLNWLKNVGDSVKSGDVIAELDSDKATVEIEAPADGVLTQQSVKVGDSVAEGTVIGEIGAAGEAGAAQPVAAAPVAVSVSASPKLPPVSTPAPAKSNGAPQLPPAPVAEENGNLPDGVKASPVARRIAADSGIDLSQVKGTGPGGRIVKEDVENFQPGKAPAAAQASTASQPSGIAPAPSRKLPEGPDVEIIDMTNMRKRIVAVTVESKQQIPHFYVTTEVDVEALLAVRKQLNDSLPTDAAKISVNDLVVKAAALTLHQFPNLNTHFYGDKLVRHKRINIGIAVALPSGGLMYVVAQDADKVALGTLAQQNKEMIARAREGKVKPNDISGATFSTSNLGPYDVEHFSAIINPPEAGIIAVGTALKVPVVKADGTLGIGNRMKVTISVDHRVSDGAEGAQYLLAFKNLIENPMRLLV
ncbi:MAG: dihydrolipoamide acetyltransferase family protein [Chloroflexota bacterium]